MIKIFHGNFQANYCSKVYEKKLLTPSKKSLAGIAVNSVSMSCQSNVNFDYVFSAPKLTFTRLAKKYRALELLSAIEKAPIDSFSEKDILDVIGSKHCGVECLEALFENSPNMVLSSKILEKALNNGCNPEVVLILVTHLSPIDKDSIILAIEKGYANSQQGTRSILYFMMQRATEEDRREIFHHYSLKNDQTVVQFCLCNFPGLVVQLLENEDYYKVFNGRLFHTYDTDKSWILHSFIEKLEEHKNKSQHVFNEQKASRYSYMMLTCKRMAALYNGKIDPLSSLIRTKDAKDIIEFLNSGEVDTIEESHCLQVLARQNEEYNPELVDIFLKKMPVSKIPSLFLAAVKLAVRPENVFELIIQNTVTHTTYAQLHWAVWHKKPATLVQKIVDNLGEASVDQAIVDICVRHQYSRDVFESLLAKAKNDEVSIEIVIIMSQL